MKSNEAILIECGEKEYGLGITLGDLFIKKGYAAHDVINHAMKEAQVEAIKEVMKRHASQDIFDHTIVWKPIHEIALELIKEIEG